MEVSLEIPSDELASIAYDLMAAKMFSLASCVMLFYDIAITFGQEVEVIWARKFSMVSLLWFLNRYLSPLGYIVVIVCEYRMKRTWLYILASIYMAFHDPSWTKATCERYVLFPEALKVVTSFVIGVIFILRLYAIYSRSSLIAAFGAALLVAELAVKIYAFTDGTSLRLPAGLVGCILVGRNHRRFVYTWIAELVFDSAIFFMTLHRVVVYNHQLKGGTRNLVHLILRDGVIYFAVIFAANVATTVIFLVAPDNLKAITASFSTLITSLMTSRLILNLRNACANVTTVEIHVSTCKHEDIFPASGANHHELAIRSH